MDGFEQIWWWIDGLDIEKAEKAFSVSLRGEDLFYGDFDDAIDYAGDHLLDRLVDSCEVEYCSLRVTGGYGDTSVPGGWKDTVECDPGDGCAVWEALREDMEWGFEGWMEKLPTKETFSSMLADSLNDEVSKDTFVDIVNEAFLDAFPNDEVYCYA